MCPRDTLMVSWGLIGDDIAQCLGWIWFSYMPKEVEKILLSVSPAIRLLDCGSSWVIKAARKVTWDGFWLLWERGWSTSLEGSNGMPSPQGVLTGSFPFGVLLDHFQSFLCIKGCRKGGWTTATEDLGINGLPGPISVWLQVGYNTET